MCRLLMSPSRKIERLNYAALHIYVLQGALASVFQMLYSVAIE